MTSLIGKQVAESYTIMYVESIQKNVVKVDVIKDF